MRTIARHAKVSQATLHHYFGHKEALYESCVAAMDAEARTLYESFLTEAPETGGAAAVVEGALRRALALGRQHKPALRLVMRVMIDEGELDERRRRDSLLPFLAIGEALLTEVSGLPTRRLRLVLHSLNLLVVRYALNSEAELREIVGKDGEQLSTVEVEAAVADHLVATAHALLGLGLGRGG
jgi:AcrR family transcriptional regulator